MRVLIRNQKTGLYLVGESAWTPDKHLGRNFGHSLNAIQFAMATQSHDLEIYIAFNDPSLDLSVSLTLSEPAPEGGAPEHTFP